MYLLAAPIVLILEIQGGEHVLIPLSARDVTVDWMHCFFFVCFHLSHL